MENWKAVREETPSQIALSSRKGTKEFAEKGKHLLVHDVPHDDKHPENVEVEDDEEEENVEVEDEEEEEIQENEDEDEVDQPASVASEPLQRRISNSSGQGRGSGSAPPTTRRVSVKEEIDDEVQTQRRRSSGVSGGGSLSRSSRRSSVINRPPVPDDTRDPRERRLSIVEGADAEDDFAGHADAALRNAKETAYTLLEKECVADDVIRVWESISKFIIFKMMEGKAVRIAGLGTFTFRIRKMPVNQKNVKVTKTPIFILSEYVSQMYRLKQEKVMISNIPEVPLNLSVIASDTKISRSLIEGILTEVLQAFARGIVCNKSLEFPFPYIGKLQIRDQKVIMRFYDEFCKKLGFHVATTPGEHNFEHHMIHGRMTPLRFHIPSDNYRSVFHLRDVRSVHEFPLLVPLVQIDGKLFPETLVEGIGGEKENRKRKTKALISLSLRKMKMNSFQDEPNNRHSETSTIGPTIITKPLYEPQKTGDCILDLMNSCPEIMSRTLRAHMYQQIIGTLGARKVKSHFRRRGNKAPVSEFSFDDLFQDQNNASFHPRTAKMSWNKGQCDCEIYD